MNKVLLGVLCGVGFGLADVALMLPLSFPDKPTALAAAFASRFAIGFLIPQVKLPLPPVAGGALVGLLVSVPDSIVTHTYAPILGTGVLGGTIIGWIAGRFGKEGIAGLR
jgi:hypothetical protein